MSEQTDTEAPADADVETETETEAFRPRLWDGAEPFTIDPHTHGPHQLALFESETPELNEWVRVGDQLRYMAGAVEWWIGQWAATGVDTFGDGVYEQLLGASTDRGYINDCLAVHLAIPEKYRRPELTWKHHRVAANIANKNRLKKVLAWAVDNGADGAVASVAQLARYVKTLTPPAENEELLNGEFKTHHTWTTSFTLKAADADTGDLIHERIQALARALEQEHGVQFTKFTPSKS